MTNVWQYQTHASMIESLKSEVELWVMNFNITEHEKTIATNLSEMTKISTMIHESYENTPLFSSYTCVKLVHPDRLPPDGLNMGDECRSR